MNADNNERRDLASLIDRGKVGEVGGAVVGLTGGVVGILILQLFLLLTGSQNLLNYAIICLSYNRTF